MDVVGLYKSICKKEKIKPLPIKFKNVGKGGAMVEYNSKTMTPLSMSFDKTKLNDIAYALYHEISHQICLEKFKYPGHGNKFKKIFNYINDKYMYSDLEDKYW